VLVTSRNQRWPDRRRVAAERATRLAALFAEPPEDISLACGVDRLCWPGAPIPLLSTVAKHGKDVLEALRLLFTTGPWMPPATADSS
jgi:hypothetical protein